MNILYITENFPPYTKGGAEISTSLIIKYVSRFQKTFVLTTRFQKDTWEFGGSRVYPLLVRVSMKNKSLFEFLMYAFNILISPLINTFIIIDFIRKNNIDIVHFVPTEYYYAPLVFAALVTRKAFLVDIRNYSLVCPSSLTNENCKKNNYVKHNKCLRSSYKVQNKFLKIFTYLISLYEYSVFKIHIGLFKLALKLTNRYMIVPNSNFVKKILILNGYSRKRMRTIFNMAGDVKTKSNDRKNRVVYAGELEKSKGIWDLISAFVLLGDKNLMLEIAGDGKEANAIKAYLKTKNIKNIKLLGRLPNKDVISLYSDSKAVIAPSVWPEPFGRFILETMATGTPLVSTNVGGTPEGIENMKTGILVEPNDPQALSAAIRKLLNNKELYRRIVLNIKKEVHKYDPEDIGPKRLDLYKSLLKI